MVTMYVVSVEAQGSAKMGYDHGHTSYVRQINRRAN
jgi:hypothetical protein